MFWNIIWYFLLYPFKKKHFIHPLCRISADRLYAEIQNKNVECFYFTEGMAYIQTGDIQAGKLKKGMFFGLIKYFWITAYQINGFHQRNQGKELWSHVMNGQNDSIYTVMKDTSKNKSNSWTSCDNSTQQRKSINAEKVAQCAFMVGNVNEELTFLRAVTFNDEMKILCEKTVRGGQLSAMDCCSVATLSVRVPESASVSFYIIAYYNEGIKFEGDLKNAKSAEFIRKETIPDCFSENNVAYEGIELKHSKEAFYDHDIHA